MGEREIYIKVMVAGVIDCNYKSFLNHLAHGYVDRGKTRAIIKGIKFHQRLV